MLFKLALRNVFRHTRRTLITALAISIGLMFMIVIDTLFGGVDTQTMRNILETDNSTLTVLPRGVFEKRFMHPLDSLIGNAASVTADLMRQNPEISSAAPRLRFNAFVNVGGKELVAFGVGIDPELDTKVFGLARSVSEGSFLKEKGDVMIGASLASSLGVKAGDPLLVETRTRSGVTDVREYTVKGIASTGNPIVDMNYIFIMLKEAQEFLEAPGYASEIDIKVRGNPGDSKRLEGLKEKYQKNLDKSCEIYTWRELNSAYFEIAGQKKSVGFLMALIVIVIALVGIVNTMLLSIYERIPELGTMRAMGFRAKDVRWMLVIEGATIGFLGGLFGVVLGGLASLYLVQVGLDFSSMTKSMSIPYPVSFKMKGLFSPSYALFVFLLGWIISILVALIPARKATRIEPREALRHV